MRLLAAAVLLLIAMPASLLAGSFASTECGSTLLGT